MTDTLELIKEIDSIIKEADEMEIESDEEEDNCIDEDDEKHIRLFLCQIGADPKATIVEYYQFMNNWYKRKNLKINPRYIDTVEILVDLQAENETYALTVSNNCIVRAYYPTDHTRGDATDHLCGYNDIAGPPYRRGNKTIYLVSKD